MAQSIVTWALNSTDRTLDIFVRGVLVEQVPTAFSWAERDARIVAHGGTSSRTLTSRERTRAEQASRGRNNGYGYSRSGRGL